MHTNQRRMAIVRNLIQLRRKCEKLYSFYFFIRPPNSEKIQNTKIGDLGVKLCQNDYCTQC